MILSSLISLSNAVYHWLFRKAWRLPLHASQGLARCAPATQPLCFLAIQGQAFRQSDMRYMINLAAVCIPGNLFLCYRGRQIRMKEANWDSRFGNDADYVMCRTPIRQAAWEHRKHAR